jgi:hypothetical protein
MNRKNQGEDLTNRATERNRQTATGNELDRDQPSPVSGRERDTAEDRSEGLRKPESGSAIPELDEPNVEGVGEEGRDDATATTPPGQGKDPKRNTM